MLHTWTLKTAISVPIHVVFEHRASDAYELEEGTLPATSLLRGGKQLEPGATSLWEDRESEARETGEHVLLVNPMTLSEASSVPLIEGGVAEPIHNAPALASITQPAASTQVKFRQALIEVDDPAVFWEGVVGGQVAAVEGQQPLSGTQIFELFESAINDLEFSETWLVGYLLGLSDALLRYRKMYPPAYTAHLKPVK